MYASSGNAFGQIHCAVLHTLETGALIPGLTSTIAQYNILSTNVHTNTSNLFTIIKSSTISVFNAGMTELPY